jgi:hypothetical protein
MGVQYVAGESVPAIEESRHCGLRVKAARIVEEREKP